MIIVMVTVRERGVRIACRVGDDDEEEIETGGYPMHDTLSFFTISALLSVEMKEWIPSWSFGNFARKLDTRYPMYLDLS